MIVPILAAFGQTLFMLLLSGVAIFLILLVLVQRGRGGGLAGALGGMGGSSAFGAKAGDVFTKITAISACFWIVLCIFATKMAPTEESLIDTGQSAASIGAPAMNAPDGEEGDASDGDQADAEAPADSDASEPAAESGESGQDASTTE